MNDKFRVWYARGNNADNGFDESRYTEFGPGRSLEECQAAVKARFSEVLIILPAGERPKEPTSGPKMYDADKVQVSIGGVPIKNFANVTFPDCSDDVSEKASVIRTWAISDVLITVRGEGLGEMRIRGEVEFLDADELRNLVEALDEAADYLKDHEEE